MLGPRLKRVPEFIGKLEQPTSEGQVPRWYGEVCPRTLGGPAEVNAYFTRRVSELAQSVGVPVGRPGCEPNVTIVITPDPDRFTRDAERTHAALFYDFSAKWPVDWSKLRRFVNTSRPVRWWTGVQVADMNALRANTEDTAGYSGGLGDQPVPITKSFGGGSRLQPPVTEKMVETLLIVDAKAIEGLKAGSVAAYLTMVLLADPKPDEDFSSIPTIMNLFADAKQGRAAPEDLTHWDRSYLRSLYKIPAGETANTERSAITAQMARELKDDDSGLTAP